MFHCVYVGAIDADVRRIEYLSWRGLVRHLNLLQADGGAEAQGCIREAVDDVLWGFFRVCEKGAVVSKQQLCDELLEGFCACEETPNVEETAVCS